jgi:hypothetical protein
LAVEAVIGIRDAGKTKKLPDAHILHSEPMENGNREQDCRVAVTDILPFQGLFRARSQT